LSILLNAKTELPVVADTLGLPCFLSCLTKHREQNCGENRDNRDHHQQFNQRKSTRGNIEVTPQLMLRLRLRLNIALPSSFSEFVLKLRLNHT
jgi:hypothetical protein